MLMLMSLDINYSIVTFSNALLYLIYHTICYPEFFTYLISQEAGNMHVSMVYSIKRNCTLWKVHWGCESQLTLLVLSDGWNMFRKENNSWFAVYVGVYCYPFGLMVRFTVCQVAWTFLMFPDRNLYMKASFFFRPCARGEKKLDDLLAITWKHLRLGKVINQWPM